MAEPGVTEHMRIVLTGDSSDAVRSLTATSIAAAALNKHMRERERMMQTGRHTADVMFAKALGNGAKMMGLFGASIIRMNLKGFILEMGVINAGLLLMKASLATGRFLMKAWGSTVNFLKISVAGLTAAVIGLVSVLAAANREFAQMSLSPHMAGESFTSRMFGGVAALRGPQQFRSVQAMGMMAPAQMIQIMARADPNFDRRDTRLLKGIADITGGDQKQAIAMAQAIAASVTGGSSQPVSDYLKGLGHIYGGVSQKAAGMTPDAMMAAISTGGLTPASMQGQGNRMADTLVGRIKGVGPRMFELFAEIGGPFLGPLKNMLAEVESIFRSTIRKIQGQLMAFGLNTFIPGVVSQFERLMDWLAKLIVQDLPRLMDTLRNIRDWWLDFVAGTREWFGDLGDRMHKFEEASAAAWEMTKNVFGEVWQFIKDRMHEWNKLILDNKAAYIAFGTVLGGVFASVLEMLTRFKDAFFRHLEGIKDFLRFLRDEVFPKLGDFAQMFGDAFAQAIPAVKSLVSALMPLVEMITLIGRGLNWLPTGVGSMAVLGGGFLAMSARGHGMIGQASMGYRGLAGWAPSTLMGALAYERGGFGAKYAARQAARQAAGTSAYFLPPPGGPGRGSGMYRPNMANPMVSGAAVTAGMLAAATLLTVMSDEGTTMHAMGEAMLPASMLAMIPRGWALPAAAVVTGTGMVVKGWGMRDPHQAGMTVGGGTALGLTGVYGTMTALGLSTGPIGGATMAAGIALLAAGAYVVGKMKGEANLKDFMEGGTREGRGQTDEALRLIGGATSREGVRAARRAYGDLTKDYDTIEQMAIEADVDPQTMLTKMEEGLLEVGLTADIAIDKWNSAMYDIADITGLTASQVETMADRWGLSLDSFADKAEFFFKMTEQWTTYRDDDGKLGGMTRDSFLANATGMIATGIENSVFVTGTKGQRTREARVQSQAANQVLFDALQAGDLDEATARDLFQDVMETTASVGAAMGLEGSQLGTFVTTAASGLAASAKRSGYTFDTSRLSPLVETMTGIGGLPTNITAFKESDLGAQMFHLMEGSGLYEDDVIQQRMQKAMTSHDPEGELALLNLEIHSDANLEAARALGTLKDEATSAAEALAILTGVAYAGKGTYMKPGIDHNFTSGAGAGVDARINAMLRRERQRHIDAGLTVDNYNTWDFSSRAPTHTFDGDRPKEKVQLYQVWKKDWWMSPPSGFDLTPGWGD